VKKTLAEIEAEIAPLDAAIRPLAKGGIDPRQPGWRDELAALKRERDHEPWRPALDRAGIRADAEELRDEIIDAYAAADDATRTAIRALFRKYDSFAWAVSLPHEPVDEALLRRTLLLFSIQDQGKDWRDAIVWLDGICARAKKASLPLSSMLMDAAKLSSDTPSFGGGRSTRHMLTAYAERFRGEK
jgi:hypothetical protein